MASHSRSRRLRATDEFWHLSEVYQLNQSRVYLCESNHNGCEVNTYMSAEGQGETPQSKTSCPVSLSVTRLTVMDSDCHCHREVTIVEPFTLLTLKSRAHPESLRKDWAGQSGKRKLEKIMNAQDSLWFTMHFESHSLHLHVHSFSSV